MDPTHTDDASPAGRELPGIDDVYAELEWLRAENALLRTEKEILLKAATWFALDANVITHQQTRRPEDR